MANLQKYFEQFHEKIRTDYDINSELADKRDIVLDLVTSYLTDKNLPKFERLLQGSYRMKTGVKPIGSLTYDIDIGLVFKLSQADYTASTIRDWVYQAVKDHTDKVELRGPCIRVHYKKGFSLDLVIYNQFKDEFGRTQMRLGHKTRGWIKTDPNGLLTHVDNAVSQFEGSEDGATKTVQIRRIIRCLKRWSDEQFDDSADLKPTGIAFTLLCIEKLSAPSYALDGSNDDSLALLTVLNQVPSEGRLIVKKPTPEYEDVFGKLTEAGMTEFKEKLFKLRDALKAARVEVDPIVACKELKSHCGEDFSVPSASEASVRTKGPAILTSSTSA